MTTAPGHGETEPKCKTCGDRRYVEARDCDSRSTHWEPCPKCVERGWPIPNEPAQATGRGAIPEPATPDWPNSEPLVCATCGKPAACIGRYESEDRPWEAACNECCGHGCEDGKCYMLADVPDFINGLFVKIKALEDA